MLSRNSLTRRTLFIGASAAAILIATTPVTWSAPQHNGGLVQVNTNGPEPYYALPTLNFFKAMSYPWQTENATEDWRLLYDARGYPTRLPSGASARWVTSNLWVYGRPGNVIVLRWPGSATLSMVLVSAPGSLTESIISANRREYTIVGQPQHSLGTGTPGPSFLVKVTISAMNADNFAGGQIECFRKDYENLIDQGGIWDPLWFNRNSQWGVHRHMDWMMQTGGSDNNIALWSHRRTINDCQWFGRKIDSALWCSGSGTNGASTGTNDQIVGQPSDPVVTWTNGRMVQWSMGSIPLFRTPSAATNAATVVFTDVAHPFLTGDQVEVGNNFGSWKILAAWDRSGGPGASYRTFTLTKIDADHYSLPVSTVSLGAYPGVTIYKQVTLKVGALAPVVVRRQGAENFFAGEFVAAGGDGTVTGYMTGTYDSALGCLLATGDSKNFMQPGCPVEVMVRFANDTGAHPYFTFGVLWVDDAITQFMTYVRDNLNPGLVPRYTFGNEIWNSGNWGTTYSNNRAFFESVLSTFNFNLWYGYRLVQIADLATAVYTGSGKSYQIILEFQAAQMNSTITTTRFQCPPFSAGDTAKYPINKCHAAAYNSYYETPFQFAANAASYTGYTTAVYNYKVGGAARQSSFDFMATALRDLSTDGGFASQRPIVTYRDVIGPFWKAAVVDVYGKKLTHYEGGQGLFGSAQIDGGFPAADPVSGVTVTTQDVQDYWFAFLRSTQFATITTQHMTDFINLGGEFPSQFTSEQPFLNGATWGIQDTGSFYNAPTAASLALRAVNNPSYPRVGWGAR
jgi:hypothetical protein